MLFCVFCIELSLHLPSFKVRGLQMTINFALVQINISSRHSNLNFAHHFVIYWLLQMARENQHQETHQRETIHDKFVFFAKLVRQNSQYGKQITRMYVSEICAEGIFVSFPWWLKNVKSRSKITLFLNERHFEIWLISKTEGNYLFQKNIILTTQTKTQFCMWQLLFP